MTHARGCCCNTDDPPGPCPAPCVLVLISGLQYVVGGTDHPCYVGGGTVALSEPSGFVGAFLLENLAGDRYSGVFPASVTTIQSEGTVSAFTTRVGGDLHVSARVGACVNGVLEEYRDISAHVSGGWVIDPGGEPIPSSWTGAVFQADMPDGGPAPMGSSVPSALTEFAGCVTQSLLGVTHGGTGTVVQPASCTLPPVYYFAENCQDPADKIIVDLYTIPPGGASSCLYQGRRYKLTARTTLDGPPVAVAWELVFCSNDPPAGDNRIAVLCRGLDQIVYDPADIVTFSRTCVWEGRRYKLTAATTNQPALPVIFSSRNCQGFDFPNCTGITGPDDPRCHDPIWEHCPRCFDSDPVDPPDPFPESPNASAGDDDDLDPGRLPGLGDMVARTLELIRLDKLASPNKCGCKRRQAILNEWGERYGRAIIKRLGL